MEESISAYSSSAEIMKQKKTPVKMIVIVLLCIAVIILVSYKVIVHKLWVEYNDKYYISFLERNGIEKNSQDQVSGWGYKELEYGDFIGRIEYHTPTKDKFTFCAGLEANSGNPDYTYWTIPGDDTHYRPYLTASVEYNGDIEYYGDLDFCYPATENQFNLCSFLIKDGDTFVFDADGLGVNNDLYSDKVLYFKDDFIEMKRILDEEILGLN